MADVFFLQILMGVEEYFPEDKVERVRQSMQWVCDDREFEKEWDTGKQVILAELEMVPAGGIPCHTRQVWLWTFTGGYLVH